jgi:hypothetical protein
MVFMTQKWYNLSPMKRQGKKTILVTVMLWLSVLTFLVNPGRLDSTDSEVHSQSPYWWYVEITIEVKGNYTYRQAPAGIDGEYAFTATILGTMQEDEDDYIFVQAFQQIKNLKWNERVFKGNVKHNFDLKEKIKPEVTLNYVFKNKKVLAFDFTFLPIGIPNNNQVLAGPLYEILLPESSGDTSINIGDVYNPGVLSGSNMVIVNEKDIYNNTFFNRTFEWSWSEQKSGLTHRHRAKSILKITRRQK